MDRVLQVIKVGDLKTGTAKASGNPYRMQECECVVFDKDGGVDFVGGLMLPKDLVEQVKCGKYHAVFDVALDRARRIGARLVSLTPVFDKVAPK